MKFRTKWFNKQPQSQSEIQQSQEQTPATASEQKANLPIFSAEVIDYIEWIGMIGLILFSLGYFMTALNKPINTTQYKMIESYSQNNRYPDTQIYAKALILHNKANQYDYLRLMYKVHNEHSQIHFRRHDSASF